MCCAFSFCWWAYGRLPTDEELAQKTENDPTPAKAAGRGEKEAQGILAGDAQGGKVVVGVLRNAQSILEGVLREAPPPRLKALLEKAFSGRGLYPYVH
jgi:hypothetical protein